MIRMIIALTALLGLGLPQNAQALQFANPLCSKKYTGKVKKIIEPEAPIHTFSKRTVVFEVTKKIKGLVDDEEKIKLLKFGPLAVEPGENYEVHMEKGSICYLAKADIQEHSH